MGFKSKKSMETGRLICQEVKEHMEVRLEGLLKLKRRVIKKAEL